ncbi:meckelin-like isoform X2 [Plodia interpunctella]|uniref:meckelin-like isoform X2 n=1 Tax=Plodia interpunctella TaxID=58824 RepID=UPI002367AD1C|nr:meckelin-like isoform X2 [Plodia interpunctella]
MILIKECVCVFFIVTFGVSAFHLPSCNLTQYYDPNLMSCQSCPANTSMIRAANGFSCVCDDHSVPNGPAKCRSCNATELVSSDGSACVPRRCQNTSGKFVCRKCPSDYITVTQNNDGSPMKEVLCVKCSRGYKAQNNVCVRCEACTCTKNHIVIKDVCVTKKYLAERPKYEETRVHPSTVLEFMKHEYLCMQNDALSCRTLTSYCVRNLYTTDLAGPCRLWIQPKLQTPKELPPLTIETSEDKFSGEIKISRENEFIMIAIAAYTAEGGFQFEDNTEGKIFSCFTPSRIRVGNDFYKECNMNISNLSRFEKESTFGLFLSSNGDFNPIPIVVRKPNGYYIKRDTWTTSKFRRYFLFDKSLSTTVNVSTTVYLRTLIIKIMIQRDKSLSSSLRGQISAEVQYATKSISDTVTTVFRVEHDLPTAGIIRGLEIWGGILGVLSTLYALVQWRGNVRRGGFLFSLVPLLGGTVADALYFAVWFSSLHALAAETGTLGMTLPLSRYEEHIIKSFVFSAVSLKFLRVTWMNWNQCRCDVFLLDWSEYNSPFGKDGVTIEQSNLWKVGTLAREWSSVQTKRRAHPGYTVTLALAILYFMSPWQTYLPKSKGYQWTLATIAWWTSYTSVLLVMFVADKTFGSPAKTLPKVCSGLGVSLIVFQEDFYAHYVHGRNEESKEMRAMTGPLATCRVVVAPQLRAVYKQLSGPEAAITLGVNEPAHSLLTQFLAAFFERALDGLNWVASERSVLERLLDVEMNARESGSTSCLLYDPDDNAASCFAVTWWGEEWALGTFDAMLFGAIVMAADETLTAAVVTLAVWKILKHLRTIFGNRNLRLKTKVDIPLFQ